MHPRDQGRDLRGSEFERLFRAEVQCAQTLKRKRAVGKLLHREARDLWLKLRAPRLVLPCGDDRWREDRQARERARQAAEEKGLPRHIRGPQVRSLGDEAALGVEQTRVPTGEAARAGKHGDHEPLAGVGRQLDRHALGLPAANLLRRELKHSVEGRPVVEDLAGHREPVALPNEAIVRATTAVANKHVELQLSAGGGDRHQEDQETRQRREPPAKGMAGAPAARTGDSANDWIHGKQSDRGYSPRAPASKGRFTPTGWFCPRVRT